MQSSNPAKIFSKLLVEWQQAHFRDYPWIGEKDPYKILLSEFLLQQTRSQQALPYYYDFIAAYPTVNELAAASESDVLNLWQGLGYYSRGRNLHKTAQIIVKQYDSLVPDDYETLLTLPGIGPYTAAAISSFAFEREHAVVDGNVIRVLSRVFNISEAYDTGSGKRHFQKLAASLIKGQIPSVFNQGIMNLGAEICTPKNYNCTSCPMSSICYARAHDLQDSLPLKSKSISKGHRYFHFFYLEEKDSFWIERRIQKDIWKHLYQLPLIETIDAQLSESALYDWAIQYFDLSESKLPPYEFICSYKQTLTHQYIHSYFYKLKLETLNLSHNEQLTLVNTENLVNFAFPRTISWFLEHYS